MKKFNDWIKNNKEEDKIMNEDISIAGTSAGSLSKVDPSLRQQTSRFETIIDKLDSVHSDEEKNVSSNAEKKDDLDRRARLIRSIQLLQYQNIDKFMNDWNFIKMHVKDEPVSKADDELNVIRNT